MISQQKTVLRSIEVLGGASGMAGVVSGVLILSHSVDPMLFEPFVFYSFFVMFLVFGVAVWVAGEYAQTVRTNASWWQRSRGLSLAELKALTQWCPRWIIYLSLVCGVAGIAMAFQVGDVQWSPGQPFTEREALGFTAGQSTFCFFALPILASASRMPGNFSRHFGA